MQITAETLGRWASELLEEDHWKHRDVYYDLNDIALFCYLQYLKDALYVSGDTE